jgi:hypothetical protein
MSTEGFTPLVGPRSTFVRKREMGVLRETVRIVTRGNGIVRQGTNRLHMRLPTLHLALRFALIAAIAIPGACGAAAVRTPHVEAELVADRAALVPGQPLTIALRLVMDRGWHTYWQNPGDSGLPTTLVWKLPPSVTAGPIQWPSPRIINVGPLANSDGTWISLGRSTSPSYP